MGKIKKILIANRGEIALRVIRACQEMGISTVAVYAEPDRESLHVRYADEAFALGGTLASESYLDVDKIFKAAEETSADAIHPGYGFLSENADFAEACTKQGLIWVGPPAQVIRDMGDKIKARQLMQEAGVPVVPGSDSELSDVKTLEDLAEEVGYPVMIKAAAGGGGKGIRRVENRLGIASAFRQSSGEALSSFANASVYLEKLITPAHHIEVQVFADQQGNAVHMGERECSLQRRSQKLIEESPSPFVSESLRDKMTSIAVKATQAIGYEGAGTFEFLVDENKNFYFLEMNTRLQVEHTVTEQVTGLDMVKEQITVAEGQVLSFKQKDVRNRGHSIEIRVCCEDPFNNFSPSVGKVEDMQLPGGPHVRLDSSLYTGMEVTLYYDPMVAKLVVWALTRERAIERLRHAVREFYLSGVKTSLPLYLLLADDPTFVAGDYHTGYLEEFVTKEKTQDEVREKEAACCVAVLEHLRKKSPDLSSLDSYSGDSWRQAALREGLKKRL